MEPPNNQIFFIILYNYIAYQLIFASKKKEEHIKDKGINEVNLI